VKHVLQVLQLYNKKIYRPNVFTAAIYECSFGRVFIPGRLSSLVQ
jgi:hypothetical protein